MDNKLTPAEQAISDLWDQHIGAEFGAHSPDGAMSTMVAEPRVNQVPVMTGGHGRAQLYEQPSRSPRARLIHRGVTAVPWRETGGPDGATSRRRGRRSA